MNVYDGFQYIINRREDNTTYFICKQHPTCKARGVLKNGEFSLTRRHNHNVNLKKLKEKAFMMHLKEFVKTQTSSSYRKIFDEVRSAHPEAAISKTFANCESIMYKWRHELQPPMPQSLSTYVDTLNLNEWRHLKECTDGNVNVSAVVDNDVSTSVVYIEVNFARQVIRNNNTIFLDATFKVVPASVGAYQFFTFMTVAYGETIPFAWALMQQKSTAANVTMFREVKRLLPELVINEAMTDYDKALQKALKQEFPGITLHGCQFHYSQALVKNAAKLGLTVFLRENEEGRKMFSLILVLPLLPADKIPEAYEELKRNMSRAIKQIMESFLNYFEKEWLRTVTPNVFSVYELTKRTNNCLESYHRTLIDKFGAHPNIWIFTKKLVKLQESLIFDLKSLQQGYAIRRCPKFKNLIKDELLQDLWEKLKEDQNLNKITFLEEAAQIMKTPIDTYLQMYN